MDIEDKWRLSTKFTITILLKLVCFPWKLNNGSKPLAVILRSCWCIIDISENIFPRFMILLQMQSFSPLTYLFFCSFFNVFARAKIHDRLWVAATASLELEYHRCHAPPPPSLPRPTPDLGCFVPLLAHSINFLPWELRRGSAKAAGGSDGSVKSVSLCHDSTSRPWNWELIFQTKGKKIKFIKGPLHNCLIT